jgi:phosphate transport system ATP-binding protein
LCIARALAVEPEVLLLDEPSSALDPVAAAAIEALMGDLRGRYTQVVVTHSMAQARRVADHAAFVYLGEVVEQGSARDVLDAPKDPRAQEFLRGRTG